MTPRENLRNQRERGVSILGVVAVIVVLGIAVLLIAPYVFSYYWLNKMIRDNPQLSLQPAPLPIVTTVDARPTTLACCGLEFDVPWGKPEPAHPSSGGFVYFRFRDGKHIQITPPESIIELLPSRQALDPQVKQAFARSLGLEESSTPYDAYSKVLYHAPQEVSLFGNREKLFGQIFIVTLKNILVPPHTSGVFSFETNHGRGFQFNDPARSEEVRIRFFENEGRQFEFSASRDRNVAPLAQADINFIVRSIRPARAEDSESSKPAAGRRPGKGVS